MESGNQKDYWEYRGNHTVQYKGETFYTITPLPYYCRRRSIVLKLLTSVIKKPAIKNICDFGCGDGWYLKYFSERYPKKQWYGVDLSESMLVKARDQCPAAHLLVSSKGIGFQATFDLIYSIAVFAHVMDDGKVVELFEDISSKLASNGYFVIFEQTAPKRRRGKINCRRTPDEYVSLARQGGLILEKRFLLAFPAHRFFVKNIAPMYYKLFSKGSNWHERSFKANTSPLFRFMSSFMLTLSGPPLRNGTSKHEGYTFFVLRKTAG